MIYFVRARLFVFSGTSTGLVSASEGIRRSQDPGSIRCGPQNLAQASESTYTLCLEVKRSECCLKAAIFGTILLDRYLPRIVRNTRLCVPQTAKRPFIYRPVGYTSERNDFRTRERAVVAISSSVFCPSFLPPPMTYTNPQQSVHYHLTRTLDSQASRSPIR